MHNTSFYLFKGQNSIVEERADYDSRETDVMLSDLPCQEDIGCGETMDTTWAKALPFVPGQRYHGASKFL